MNIALIRCAGILNIGNEFINFGGENLVKSCFPDATFYLFESEKSTKPLLDSEVKFIEDTCKIGFYFCGSLISKEGFTLLEHVSKIKIPIVLLGIGLSPDGAADYEKFPQYKELAKKVANMFPLIFVRDLPTFNAMNASNVYLGIDMGFFAGDNLAIPSEKQDYALYNNELNGGLLNNIVDYNRFRKEHSKTFAVENKMREANTSCGRLESKFPGFLFHGHWETLYLLIANASYVETSRLHTTVVCLTNGVKFKYVHPDAGGKTGRNTLFNEVGFILERNVVTDGCYKDKVTKAKEKFRNDFKNVIYNEYKF